MSFNVSKRDYRSADENNKHLTSKILLTQDDLFPNDWMTNNTTVPNWNEFCAQAPWAGPFDDDSINDLRDIYVSKNSKFITWEDMLSAATNDAILRSLAPKLHNIKLI